MGGSTTSDDGSGAGPTFAATSTSAHRCAEDDRRLAGHAEALADGIERALPSWVEAAVARRIDGVELERCRAAIEAAGRAAADDVGVRIRELLELDIDQQWTNPLTLLRSAIRYPNDILRAAGASPVPRDEHATRFLPDDVYDLAPASFADLGPDLQDLGISWGAAKAHVHLRRRRAEEMT